LKKRNTPATGARGSLKSPRKPEERKCMDKMPRTEKRKCPTCGSADVHFVSPGGTAGFGGGEYGKPLADIWECDEQHHPFLLTAKSN
jgi:hypothetical protein